jgi:hypothetical protein
MLAVEGPQSANADAYFAIADVGKQSGNRHYEQVSRKEKQMKAQITATKRTYCGVFMVTLATLMYEILLTRIFSVTLWYHFAFMVVSIAMFGMAVGAMRVYLDPKYSGPESLKYQLGRNALLFSATVFFGFLIHFSIPSGMYKSALGPIFIALTYALISVPFGFSGICVCLALTKFPRQVSKLYAADLVGAALGCVLLIYTLKFTDGPTAVVFVALLAAAGSIFFLEEGDSKSLKWVARLATFLLLLFAVTNGVLAAKGSPLLRLKWAKFSVEDRPLYEKWNSFSRIQVDGNPDELRAPEGWGLSPTLPANLKARELGLHIDATAGTVLTAFDGDLSKIEHLKYDVTNVAHYLRPNSDVLAVGTGGGRDILAALAFRQKSVLGVEINRNIINAVNGEFGDFTGHLDRIRGVSFVNDEARSYVARSRSRFDIVQISLIDTWAATAGGAFILTENSLYTTEAWGLFLEHLNPRGILTVSRWYSLERPREMYRLVSLAGASLNKLGIRNSRQHIVVMCMPKKTAEGRQGVGTILVSREPFSEGDLESLSQISQRMKFEVALTPAFSQNSTFATVAEGGDLQKFFSTYPLNIAAPTDDNPFFFHMLRFRKALDPEQWKSGPDAPDIQALGVLATLLITVLGLSCIYVFVPFLKKTKGCLQKGVLPLLLFFSAIGVGYMLIEISQMERLMIFLGHPTYGLSVVLFALLLSSGLGSHSTARLGGSSVKGWAATGMLLLLLLVLLGFGKLTPHITSAFQASDTPVRIIVAVAILFPLGFLMGMPFPLGIKVASAGPSGSITPGLWAMNGATSVCASVLAIVIALGVGISTSFWAGFACYLASVLAFLYATRRG